MIEQRPPAGAAAKPEVGKGSATMPVESITAGAECGVHVCYIADERSTSARLLGHFAHCGLAKGQRVVWLVDPRGPASLSGLPDGKASGDEGAPLDPIEVTDVESVYFDGGSFDPDRALDRYRAEVEASVEAGYSGLRVVADTSWLADRPSQFEAWVDYEHRANALFADGRFAAICHYDPARLPFEWLRAVRDAHPLQAQPGPEARISAGICQVWPTDDGIAVAGEIDSSNAGAVRALLREHTTSAGDVRVDASRLRFVDVAGARALLDAALALGDDRRLLVRGAPRSLTVVMRAMGWAGTEALAVI